LQHAVRGGPGFAPAPADYDGDGRADVAVYWPTYSQWIILQSATNSYRVVNYGGANVDDPAPADFDGDGKADLAVYWTVGSEFGISLSKSGAQQTWALGQIGLDEPAVVPESYLWADVVHITAVARAAVARPAVVTAEPTAETTAAAPTPPASPPVPPAVTLAPSNPRGTLVAQAVPRKPVFDW
jgi:hypothetical protein